jgi:hypothetical protein
MPSNARTERAPDEQREGKTRRPPAANHTPAACLHSPAALSMSINLLFRVGQALSDLDCKEAPADQQPAYYLMLQLGMMPGDTRLCLWLLAINWTSHKHKSSYLQLPQHHPQLLIAKTAVQHTASQPATRYLYQQWREAAAGPAWWCLLPRPSSSFYLAHASSTRISCYQKFPQYLRAEFYSATLVALKPAGAKPCMPSLTAAAAPP